MAEVTVCGTKVRRSETFLETIAKQQASSFVAFQLDEIINGGSLGATRKDGEG
jgi:hypothetical protein